MKYRPIDLRQNEVLGVLAGRQTQIRRVIKKQPEFFMPEPLSGAEIDNWREVMIKLHSRFGQPGDRLWGRETWTPGYYHDADHDDGPRVSVLYKSDSKEQFVPAPSYEFASRWDRAYSDDGGDPPPWRSPIIMPRWASRITLDVIAVRVERLQEISEADARAEGSDLQGFRSLPDGIAGREYRISFSALWESIHGPESWDANPLVWVIEFKRVEGGAE